MRSNWSGPVNIGSEEMISINDLAKLIMKIANKNLEINHISGPIGVLGRNSDNKLIQEKLNWSPSMPLSEGLQSTYSWIEEQVRSKYLERNYFD